MQACQDLFYQVEETIVKAFPGHTKPKRLSVNLDSKKVLAHLETSEQPTPRTKRTKFASVIEKMKSSRQTKMIELTKIQDGDGSNGPRKGLKLVSATVDADTTAL